jgi:small-conductance mechanosensitive channel
VYVSVLLVGTLAAHLATRTTLLLANSGFSTESRMVFLLHPLRGALFSTLWVAVGWATFRPILGDGLTIAPRMTKVFFAMAICVAVFAIRVVLVAGLEVYMYSSYRLMVREARTIDRFMLMATMGHNPSPADASLMNRTEKVRKSFVGNLHIIWIAKEIVRRGVSAFSSELPVGVAALHTAEKERFIRRLAGNVVDLASEGHDITRERLMEVLQSAHNAAGGFSARKAAFLFELLDVDGDDLVTYRNLEEGFSMILDARASMISELKGHELVGTVASDVLLVVVCMIDFFVLLSSLGVNINSIIVPASTLFFSLSFGLWSVVSPAITGFHFVFFRRPYELGDMITLGATPAPASELIVQDVTIMSTIFRSPGGFEVSHSNSTLSALQLNNLRRSTASELSFALAVDSLAIDQATIDALQAELAATTAADPRVYQSNLAVSLDIGPIPSKILLKVTCGLKCPWQDKKIISAAKTKLVIRAAELSSSLRLPLSGDQVIKDKWE